jgi:iron(III) transport system ATP-binding protein
LLFDEPLSNLDARLRRSMREEIRALQQRLGVTVVYVTHDQSEAMAVSDTIVVMRNSEIAQAGSPADLYAHPKTVFVASFMGEANTVKGTVEAVSGDSAKVSLTGLKLDLPSNGLGAGAVDVVIRPESVLIGKAGKGIAGKIAKSTYMGAHSEYTVATALGDLFVIAPDRLNRRKTGETVGITLADDGVILVRP